MPKKNTTTTYWTQKHPFRLVSTLYLCLLALWNYAFYRKCGFVFREWFGYSFLETSFLFLYLSICLPLLYQLLNRNKLGWAVLNTILLWWFVKILVMDNHDLPSEAKSGEPFELAVRRFIWDTVRVFLIFAAWIVLTFPRNRRVRASHLTG